MQNRTIRSSCTNINMEKTIHSKEYSRVLEMLREAREMRQLTQTDVAKRLGETQSFVSKVERGERRLDVVELRSFCNAIGVPFVSFMSKVESTLKELTK